MEKPTSPAASRWVLQRAASRVALGEGEAKWMLRRAASRVALGALRALALRLRRGAVRVEMHAYGYDAAPLGGCMRVAYGVKYRVLPTRRRRGRR